MSNRGYFGIGIENVKHPCNVGTLWRSAHILGASYIFTIGDRYKKMKSDVSKAYRHIPLFEYKDVNHFKLSVPRECSVVGVELNNKAYKLENYCHPESCVYILGAEDVGLSQDMERFCDNIVVLPGDFSLNVATAGSIVMYDRLVKRNQGN